MSARTVWQFAVFCSATLLSQLGMILISGLDLPIVAAFDFHAAGYYSVASSLSNVLITPYNAVLATLMPVASGIGASNQARRLGEVLIRSTRYSTALLCLMALPLLAGMSTALHFWVGDEYTLASLPVAALLVLAQFFRLLLAPYATITFSAGQQARMLLSPLIEGMVNVLLSLVLVRSQGAVGVAIGTLAGAFAGLFVHFTFSMPRTDAMDFSRWQLLREGILLPLGCALPCALLVLRLPARVSARLAVLSLAEVALLLTLYSFALAGSERQLIRGSIGRLLRLPARALGKAHSK